ncbi:PHB depolymerase family esterase [uncultured Jannaschia sp.]|uniref:extracellular catalytic domain type 1 short-chain-length polyhydroxyalkanoate depolymerase n=1 Tax=uncultured Jannaschia sp. TaxID=293347 RepID=UPI0026180AA5|nr:PHB depolymerase family esterase [uncultured Jannaschia sp.]
MADMSEILNMVREGRLNEATASIQRRLSDNATASPETGPMKDVTPPSGILPESGTATRMKARGKSVRPKREAWTGKPRRPATEPPLPAGSQWLARQGDLAYRLFVPSAPKAGAPLIVMLHGCTQTPEDFAAGTGMQAAAEVAGAHVIWPEQSNRANMNRCWNWFEPAHQGRSGEAARIVEIVAQVLDEIGGRRTVHAAGLSAGGAMAAILGAQYPEVFTSIGIHSGLPAGSAQDVPSAFAAMGSGGRAGTALAVPAIVFHGTADRTVAFANAAALLPGGELPSDAPLRRERIGGRQVSIATVTIPGQPHPSELWEIAELGHAWSGGDAAGSYADPAGPDATAEMMRFFVGD